MKMADSFIERVLMQKDKEVPMCASHLPLRRPDRATLVDDPLDLGVLRSPPSEGVASLTGAGSGLGS